MEISGTSDGKKVVKRCLQCVIKVVYFSVEDAK